MKRGKESIESNIWDFFINENYEKIPNNILNQLIDRGYLYKNKNKEYYIKKNIFKNFIKISFKNIKRFVFVPTFYCNLSCKYCFERKLYNNKSLFNKKILSAAFKTIKTISNDNYKIELYGGEPLLPSTFKIVKDIFNFSLLYKSKITLITNGIYIKKFLNDIIIIKDFIEMIQITLDGIPHINNNRRFFKSGRGTFKIISKNINSLINNNINVCLRVNIDINNIDSIPDLYNYIKENNLLNKNNLDIKLSLVTDHINKYNNSIFHEEKILEKLINIYGSSPKIVGKHY